VETVKTDGLILRAFPLAEKDKIIVVYTRVLGKISGVVPRARQASRHSVGRLEPFGLVELMFLIQAQQELVKFRSVELVSAFGARLPSYQNFLQLSLIAEILLETSPEREPNDDLFRLLLLVMPEFENPDRGALAGLYFKVWYLKIAGLLPATRVCQKCGKLLAGLEDVFIVNGFTGLVCGSCRVSQDRRISSPAYRLWTAIRQYSLDDLWNEWNDSRSIADLSGLTESMLETNFERHFQSLQLLRREGA
jgi:DNA repair protein RecO (recombination protein O)